MTRALHARRPYIPAGLSLLILLGLVAATTQDPDPSPAPAEEIPAWFLEHMAFMTQGTGRWITDNSAYRSDDEPNDAYGMEWTWGLGQKSMKGRLFGLQDGKEVGTYWEFHLFWHPGEQQPRGIQLGGNGTLITSKMIHLGEGKIRMEELLIAPDGTRQELGHTAEHTEDGAHVTQSFNIIDGDWKPRRAYTWYRES